MTRTDLVAACLVAMLAAPIPVAAEDNARDRLDELEERLERVESEAGESSGGFLDGLPDWTRRFHLSGNADLSYLYGERNSIAEHGRFAVENARLFFEVDLGGEVRLFDHTVIESSGFYFEWDLFRKADFQNDVGSLYVRFDALGGSDLLSVKFGRFALPFGEEYLRFHEERPDNPLISFSTASVYGLDEGVLLFGSIGEGLFQYMLAVTDGDDDLGQNSEDVPAVTAKLVLEPTSWLHLSASGHRTGQLAATNDTSFGKSALMFGEFGIYPIVIPDFVTPIFEDGARKPADPSRKVHDFYAFEGDVILHDPRFGHLWLSYGRVFVESNGRDSYDRDLHYWTAEGMFELGVLWDMLDPFYLAARYSAIGTFDNDRGWRLRVLNDGGNLGYNVDHVQAYNLGVGVRLGEHVTLKGEYTWFDFNLVDGASSTFGNLRQRRDYGGVEATLAF